MTKQVRDWNKDIALLKDITAIIPKDAVIEIAVDYLTSYKELKEQCAAEKERADKLQTELSEYTEAYWKAFEQEKKLREAIERATSQSWSGDMSALLDIKNELKASLYPKEEEAK